MARDDYVYINIPKEQGLALNYIVNHYAKKYGEVDRNQLTRMIIGQFLWQYEMNRDIIISVNNMKDIDHKDFNKPTQQPELEFRAPNDGTSTRPKRGQKKQD